MINVTDLPVDIEEMRLWASGYREEHDLSWAKFAEQLDGIPAGTLQPFCKGNYQGKNDRIARTIYKFRQTLQAVGARQITIPQDPGFFRTETSDAIKAMMIVAHMGRITMVGTGPGTGKTKMAREYAASADPVWIATMRESTRRIGPMVQTVQAAVGVPGRSAYTWTSAASKLVADQMRGKRGLLIIDEANNLDLQSLEEIRSWHDETGVGVCLLGNEELVATIESGRRSHAFARLNSRIAQRLVQNLPREADIDAFCDAWGLTDPGIRKLLQQVAMMQGSGGLRECRQIVEAASMLAADAGKSIDLNDFKDAKALRAQRLVRAI